MGAVRMLWGPCVHTVTDIFLTLANIGLNPATVGFQYATSSALFMVHYHTYSNIELWQDKFT